MENPSDKLSAAIQQTVERLEKGLLRPLQKEGFLCSAKCCDTTATTMDQLQQCVQQCQTKPEQAQQVMSKELQQFQERVQRCAMACSDAAQDKLPTDGSEPSQELLGSLEKQVTSCVMKCVDTHTDSLKSLSQRVEGVVKRL